MGQRQSILPGHYIASPYSYAADPASHIAHGRYPQNCGDMVLRNIEPIVYLCILTRQKKIIYDDKINGLY